MTIDPFLRNTVFGPEDVRAMSTALVDVCNALDLADDAKSTRELIAEEIIALTRLGECSRQALRDRVLREFTAVDARGVRRLVRAYRVFPVNPEGRSGPERVVECADDDEAIRLARGAMNRQDAEVWEAARFVARLQWVQSPEERIGGE